jgi:anthranilate synthase component 2
VELLRQSGYADFHLLKNDEINVQDARFFDKIIISPGPATPAESGNILEIIEAHAPTHPILGICLGHQAIALSFGAKLKNIESPCHGFQTEIEVIASHKIFAFDERTFKAGLYHSWVVEDAGFPECLQITSRSKENYIMSFKHQQYDVHGVQFHPESYMTEYGKEMLSAFLK